MATLSKRQELVLQMVCVLTPQPEPFEPCYPTVRVYGKALASARRLAKRGLLLFLEDGMAPHGEEYGVFMGTDAGRAALAETEATNGD